MGKVIVYNLSAIVVTSLMLLLFSNRLTRSKETDLILIVHGGAGTINEQLAERKRVGMVASIRHGFQHLLDYDDPVGSVEAAIHVMENSSAFNAGYGSVLTDTGEIEMDAIIINGTDLSTGAVGAMKHVRNPVSVARFVLNSTRHVFLVGEFAEKFAASKGIPLVPTSDLIANDTRFERRRAKRNSYYDVGTCGAVAINSKGQIAAATSTGGLRGKMEGRVGDTPIVGAGTLADDDIGGISATGSGEGFIRYRVASRIAKLMQDGVNTSEAIARVLNSMTEKLPEMDGGCIAISKDGEVGFQWNSEQLAWAYVKNSEMEIHYGVNRGEDDTVPFK